VRKLLHFRLKNGNNFQYKHSENMQTSQGYIFCILQHFVTKFCNFTDFNKLFTGIYFFLPKSKISLTCNLIVYWVLAQFKLRTDSTFSLTGFPLPWIPEPSRHFNLLFTVEGSGIQGSFPSMYATNCQVFPCQGVLLKSSSYQHFPHKENCSCLRPSRKNLTLFIKSRLFWNSLL
jgi:hypothetical protein